jgi:MFS family permease
MAESGRAAKAAGREAADSKVLVGLGKAGLAARGVLYVIVGVLAARIAFGDHGEQADRGGAIEEIGEKPFGEALLWLLVVALIGMCLWRLTEAAFGQAVPDGRKASKRLVSLGRAVFYGFVVASLIGTLTTSGGEKGQGQGGSGEKTSKDLTAKALDWPAGRYLVGLVGLVLIGVGVGMAVRYAMRRFREKLRTGEMGPTTRRVVDVLGMVGGISRGVVFAAVGVFVVVAAVRFDPQQAKGVDRTLRSFADTPAGPSLLVVIALGLVVFGVYSFAEARWRRVR